MLAGRQQPARDAPASTSGRPDAPRAWRQARPGRCQHTAQRLHRRRLRPCSITAAAAVLEEAPAHRGGGRGEGHVALLQGLGEVGDVAAALMPWLLRLAFIRCDYS